MTRAAANADRRRAVRCPTSLLVDQTNARVSLAQLRGKVRRPQFHLHQLRAAAVLLPARPISSASCRSASASRIGRESGFCSP
jgi:hypothetical protein